MSLRAARPEDAEACGRICFEAFSAINAKHGFPCDFPGPEVTVGLMSMLFAHPGAFYCVVAEADGRIVGSNVMDERSAIRGVGPINGGSEDAEQRCGAQADARGAGSRAGARRCWRAAGAGGVSYPVHVAVRLAGV